MPIINSRGNASARAFGFTSAGDSRVLLSATPGPSATISTYSGYVVFKFTATGTLNVGAGVPGTADVFVVAGGATGTDNSSGVSGAGGARTESPAFSITANTPIPVVVGGTATNSTFGPVTSSGGTAGGASAPVRFPPLGSPGIGGNGPTNSYETGSAQNYGGGGGGGGFASGSVTTTGAAGGLSGGGPGGTSGWTAPRPSGEFPIRATAGTAGTANTGGGGGGAGQGGPGSPPVPGGTGGSGVVIVRFPNTTFRTS